MFLLFSLSTDCILVNIAASVDCKSKSADSYGCFAIFALKLTTQNKVYLIDLRTKTLILILFYLLYITSLYISVVHCSCQISVSYTHLNGLSTLQLPRKMYYPIYFINFTEIVAGTIAEIPYYAHTALETVWDFHFCSHKILSGCSYRQWSYTHM